MGATLKLALAFLLFTGCAAQSLRDAYDEGCMKGSIGMFVRITSEDWIEDWTPSVGLMCDELRHIPWPR